jgi:hypothetical protein
MAIHDHEIRLVELGESIALKGRHTMRIVLYVFGAIFVAAATPVASAPPGQLEMSYQFKETAVTLREPVLLLFKVHNGLEQPVALDLGVNWIQFFEFELTSPEGKAIRGRSQRSEGLSTQPGKFIIGPGEDYQQELLLNQWFDFDLPGQYFLRARLNTAIDMGGVSTPPPQASRLALEIRPRNTERLTKVCSELARQVLMARGGEAEQKALLKLSYVNDPVAVPYLAQVLSQHRINYSLAISGLENIGNEAAVEVLLSTLSDTYADMADLARQALTRMQDRISNPNLKETVKRELALKRG